MGCWREVGRVRGDRREKDRLGGGRRRRECASGRSSARIWQRIVRRTCCVGRLRLRRRWQRRRTNERAAAAAHSSIGVARRRARCKTCHGEYIPISSATPDRTLYVSIQGCSPRALCSADARVSVRGGRGASPAKFLPTVHFPRATPRSRTRTTPLSSRLKATTYVCSSRDSLALNPTPLQESPSCSWFAHFTRTRITFTQRQDMSYSGYGNGGGYGGGRDR